MKTKLRTLGLGMLLAGLIVGAVPGATVLATPSGGNQGCTPGYWKNHSASWSGTVAYNSSGVAIGPFTTGMIVGTIFYTPGKTYFGQGATLIQALAFKGGSGIAGA